MLAPAVRGGEVEQWDEIKAAVSEALIEGGGTITHHHAVGRDHRPWYDRQRPAPFAAALRAAKAELDPAAHPQPRRPDRPLTQSWRIRRLVPLQTKAYGAIMQTMREKWTDERLDDLNAKVDRGFERVATSCGLSARSSSRT